MCIRKIILCCASLVIFILALSGTALAHSGGTDSNGGHHDYKNKSGLGSYHYHHGMGPHLHPNGICPYDTSAPVVVDTPRDTISVDNLPSKIQIGDIVSLSWTVTYYTTYSISWSSSDSSVLSVTDSGMLTAKSEGKAVITATMYNGSKSFTVTVVPIQATEILLDAPDKLEVGDTYSATASILPANASDKSVTWKSSNKSVATVTESGVITALSTGTTKITITTVNGVKNSFVVEVYEILPESIKLDQESVELPLNSSLELLAEVIPANTTKSELIWKSSDSNIVTVTNGVIYGNSVGDAVIWINCQNIVTELPVKVYEVFPTGIELDTESLRLNLGENELIKANVMPLLTSHPEIIWKSNDEKVAVVYQTGVVKPVSLGNAIITATCQDIIVEIPVETYINATHLTIGKGNSVRLEINQSIDLPVSIKSDNAAYSDYEILSSNDSVIQISENRLVAKNLGNAIITITNGGLTDTFKVIVFSPLLNTILLLCLLFIAVFVITRIIDRRKKRNRNVK